MRVRPPTMYGEPARRALVALWGLPNVDPSQAEFAALGARAWFKSRRVLFVDDDRAGASVAYWEPGVEG